MEKCLNEKEGTCDSIELFDKNGRLVGGIWRDTGCINLSKYRCTIKSKDNYPTLIRLKLKKSE